MVLCAHITQTPFIFIDALHTDADSRFSTYAARNDGWDIPGKNVDSPPLHMPFEVCPGILVPSSSPERRTGLLDHARQTKSSYPKGQIDVFLHEGLINDAIAALDPYASHTLVEQVVDAALQLQSQLDWVIQACRKQAEYIMDRGKAELYSSAANWLAKARKAYQMLEHQEEWQTYLDELLSQHGRKYKLVPMLKALR